MAKQGLDGWAIRYAVRIARRLEFSEGEIRSLVHAAAAGEDVPVGARVLAVLRTFQALLMTGRDQEQALTQIKRLSGSHLDHEVVGALLTLIREDAMAALLLVRSAGQQHTSAA